jgi:hypothetical protein
MELLFGQTGLNCRVMSGCFSRVGDLGTKASRFGDLASFWIAWLERPTPPTSAPLVSGSLRLLGAHGEAHHLAILDAAATTDQREADAGVADAGYENFVLMELHRHDLALA